LRTDESVHTSLSRFRGKVKTDVNPEFLVKV
jgi:hypothetical protein